MQYRNSVIYQYPNKDTQIKPTTVCHKQGISTTKMNCDFVWTLNYNDLVHLLIYVFLLTKNNSQIILSTTKYKTYFH
jgi:hypothetical protein